MATFDYEAQRIIVRIVYDGIARAGKTTNLRQVSSIYATRRRGELVTPDEAEGQTMYFDLVQLEGGVIAGCGLRCQLLTVPGQPELQKRRQYLLQGADVVIHVCDSGASALQESRAGFETLRAALGDKLGDDVPLVVQANRRDSPDAVPLDTLARELGLPKDTPIVPACAHEGVGVRETVVQAIRAAAQKMQDVLQRETIDRLPRSTENWEELYAALRAIEPMNAKGPVAPEDRVTRPRFSLAPSLPTAVFTRSTRPPPGSRRPSEMPREARASNVPPAMPSRRPPPPSASPSQSSVRPLPAKEARGAELFEEVQRVPLLEPDAPEGFVWPNVIGRRVLHQIARERFVLRQGARVENPDGTVYDVGAWVVQSGAHRRYDTRAAGKSALQRLALTRLRLDTLFQPDTVLALELETGGTCQLWTLTPRLPLLRDRLIVAAHLGDEAALGDALASFAEAVVAGLRVAARHGVVIQPTPENFALDGDRALYVGDELCAGSRIEDIGAVVLRPLTDLAHLGGAIERYLARFEEALTAQLSRVDIARLGLIEELHTARTIAPQSLRGATRLIEALRRCREPVAA